MPKLHLLCATILEFMGGLGGGGFGNRTAANTPFPPRVNGLAVIGLVKQSESGIVRLSTSNNNRDTLFYLIELIAPE